MTQPYMMTLCELRDRLRSRELSAREAVGSCLERIRATEPSLSALISVQEEQALERAGAMDAQGPDPQQPLWAVPVILKDALTTKGVPTTCGSRMLEGFVPFYDAHAVKLLKNAGAIVLGKSNMDEFAMGSSTEGSAFSTTRNPWDVRRVPGGSSGGSAASVAAGQCPAALGSDTGGSIRQPASLCGIVGMKPTYGRVSRSGLVAFGSSLDQIGPMTRTVADNAAVLDVIAGHDPWDSTSEDRGVPAHESLLARRRDLKGLTLGVPKEFWGEGMTPEVESVCRGMVDMARDLGAELVDVSMPSTQYSIAAYYIIATAEASSNLARFDGVRYGYRDKDAHELIEMYIRSRSHAFGEEVKRRIMLGTYVLSAGYYDAYYRKAAQVRRLVRREFDQALRACDLIIAPASPATAFRVGELTADPLQMYLTDVYTIPLNLTGLPGICIPAGLGSETGLPSGLQIFGPWFGEPLIYQAAQVLEHARGPFPCPPI
jgi:aspartyl-tRNA(Asn)/glutamyl-tRNA(Gln) amidotransferase subunit A